MDEQTKTARTTLTLPKGPWKELQKRCIDLEVSNTEALGDAIELWLQATEAKAAEVKASSKTGATIIRKQGSK